MTVLGIMLLIPSHPPLHPRLIKRRRIKAHDLRIAENAQQRRNVVQGHPTQVEAWGFEEDGFHDVGLSSLCVGFQSIGSNPALISSSSVLFPCWPHQCSM